MNCSFIFYGSLKNVKLIKKILKTSPTKRTLGFIKGYLYEVTDETEPNNIFKYPIVILDDNGLQISAWLTQFTVSNNSLAVLKSRLNEFEGPLYEPKETTFYEVDGKKSKGIVFVAKSSVIIGECKNIKKIVSQIDVNY
ncbi:MAG: hypothetical protein ACKKL5_03010 [Candidatus Komeilibacteria bacterium]